LRKLRHGRIAKFDKAAKEKELRGRKENLIALLLKERGPNTKSKASTCDNLRYLSLAVAL
jgi:hypothetical protein